MLIVDGTYLIYKSFYSSEITKKRFHITDENHLQKIARNSFLNNLSRLLRSFPDTRLFIVFDGEEENFRYRLLPSYKSHRKKKPEELFGVKQEIYHFLKEHRFCFQIAEEVEGDDLIASYVCQNQKESISIFTGDADLAALVRKNVTLLLEKEEKPKDEKARKKIYQINQRNFHRFFQIPPSRFSDFKSLQGDKSDALKGVKGLIKTEAIHLLMEYPSIEDYLKNGQNHYLYDKLWEERESILLNKKVATLKTDCSITMVYEESDINQISLPEHIVSKVYWPTKKPE